MTLINDFKNHQSDWQYLLLIWFASLFGAYLFFENPSLTDIYKTIGLEDPYVLLSQNIFQPNYSYLSESILLPLFAKLLGANFSYQTYLTLCAFVTLLILPVITYFSKRNFNSIAKSLLLVFLFAVTFKFLYKYWLGFPDPLTIILVITPVFYRRQNLIFLAAFFAGLSHFSMAVIALAGCSVLLFFSKQRSDASDRDSIKPIVIGLVCAKIALWMWYFIFEYHLNSRLDIVFEYGLGFFIKQYEASVSGFWLTPGVPFLALYFCIALYFLSMKRALFSLAMLVPVSLSYLAVFLTTDGLRVFAVTISSAYVFVLKEFVNAIYPTVQRACISNKLFIERFLDKVNYKNFYLSCGLIITFVWFLVVDRAKSRGLLVNELPLLLKTLWGVSYYYIGVCVASSLIFFTVALPGFRQNSFIFNCIKVIFIFPLSLIFLQYLRTAFFPAQVFTLWVKLTLVFLLLLIALAFLKLNILKLLNYFNCQIDRVFKFIFSLN